MKEKERVISEELKKKKINFKEFNRERMYQIVRNLCDDYLIDSLEFFCLFEFPKRDETNKRKAASEEKINAAKKVEEKIKQRA